MGLPKRIKDGTATGNPLEEDCAPTPVAAGTQGLKPHLGGQLCCGVLPSGGLVNIASGGWKRREIEVKSEFTPAGQTVSKKHIIKACLNKPSF